MQSTYFYNICVQPFGAPGALVAYGAPQAYPGAPPPQQQYGAPPAAPQQQYGGAQNYSQSAGTPFDSLGQGGAPPPAVNTAPTSVTPRAQASPSTLGFGSPQPDFSGFQSPPPAAVAPANDFAGQYGAPPAAAPANDFSGQYGAPPPPGAPSNDFPPAGQYGAPPPGAPSNDFPGQYGAPPTNDFSGQYGAPANDFAQPFTDNNQFGAPPAPGAQDPASAAPGPALSMNALHGEDNGLLNTNGNSGAQAEAPAGSLADQAYAKFASMDQFDLVSKKEAERANPFESAPVGAQQSLADMKKTSKVRLFCMLERRKKCVLSLSSCLSNDFYPLQHSTHSSACEVGDEYTTATSCSAWCSRCIECTVRKLGK